jgi:hypothetical protein
VERNGVYIDGSARMAEDLSQDGETGATP